MGHAIAACAFISSCLIAYGMILNESHYELLGVAFMLLGIWVALIAIRLFLK